MLSQEPTHIHVKLTCNKARVESSPGHRKANLTTCDSRTRPTDYITDSGRSHHWSVDEFGMVGSWFFGARNDLIWMRGWS